MILQPIGCWATEPWHADTDLDRVAARSGGSPTVLARAGRRVARQRARVLSERGLRGRGRHPEPSRPPADPAAEPGGDPPRSDRKPAELRPRPGRAQGVAADVR